MNQPLALYGAARIRDVEAAMIAAGTPGIELMRRAGAAAAQHLRQHWPQARTVTIVCGGGNNGGDGYALAGELLGTGHGVRLLAVSDPGRLRGEAALAWSALSATELVPVRFTDSEAQALLASADVIVDALLGLGVRAPLSESIQQAIAAINAAGRPVLSLDLPSGLDPDTGQALPAVRATRTLTFIGMKQGLLLGDGPLVSGAVECAAIGAEPFLAGVAPSLRRSDATLVRRVLPPRPRDMHKAQSGRVLVIGGGPGMPGAVRLAAEAALRVGAGLVTVASLPAHEAIVLGARPELMFRGVDSAQALQELLPAFDVIAIGPGLGTGDWSRAMLQAVLDARRSAQALVLDADALNLIAAQADIRHCDDWVLTPHPGEAARLLGWSTQQIQSDRLAAVRALREQRGGVIVLKGAGTLVSSSAGVPVICDRGNPGMAVPGMGDVLTGVIAGLLAQHRDASAAAAAGVLIHATAGDDCARSGQRGILALDVAARLPRVLSAMSA